MTARLVTNFADRMNEWMSPNFFIADCYSQMSKTCANFFLGWSKENVHETPFGIICPAELQTYKKIVKVTYSQSRILKKNQNEQSKKKHRFLVWKLNKNTILHKILRKWKNFRDGSLHFTCLLRLASHYSIFKLQIFLSHPHCFTFHLSHTFPLST